MKGPVFSVVQDASAPSLFPARPQVVSASLRNVTCARTTRMLSMRSVSLPMIWISGPSVAEANRARDASAAVPPTSSAVDTENETVALGLASGDAVSPQARRESAAAGVTRYRRDQRRCLSMEGILAIRGGAARMRTGVVRAGCGFLGCRGARKIQRPGGAIGESCHHPNV